MGIRQSDILLHPVRLRIVLAMAGDEVTTSDIAKRLPDVPQATMYRHVARLAHAGILEIVDEQQVRGAVEKTYRVNTEGASIDVNGATDLSAEEHLQAFTTFAGILIETYGRYLDTPGSTPSTDGVSFRQARLWLTSDELEGLIADVTTALAPYLDLKNTPERRPRLLSTILMPEPVSTDE